MKLEEFLDDENHVDENAVVDTEPDTGEEAEDAAITEELDVQKAVVESLAAEKVAQDEQIEKLTAENNSLRAEVAALTAKISEMEKSVSSTRDEFKKLDVILEKNDDGETSSKISLIDRNMEIDDRFPGETRDHVLEVIKEARDRDEAEGRSRRAQLLEGVLVANEPNGTLAARRAELKKIFDDNANVINGTVIAELNQRGISHKHGEDYLLTSEIIKRTY